MHESDALSHGVEAPVVSGERSEVTEPPVAFAGGTIVPGASGGKGGSVGGLGGASGGVGGGQGGGGVVGGGGERSDGGTFSGGVCHPPRSQSAETS